MYLKARFSFFLSREIFFKTTTLFVLFTLTLSMSVLASEQELRGVWLTKTASRIYHNKQNIATAMDSLKKIGMNAIFPCIFDNGYTLYPSRLMESLINMPVDPFFSGRDLLAEIITEAHRLGIEVHPWIEFGFAAAFGRPGPILERYPDWAGRRLSTGAEADDDQFYWMSQANPQVQEFLINMALEIVTQYDVDGIMFDRIRYGNVKNAANELITTDFGYDEAHIERYQRENNGQNPPNQAWNGAWMKWRAKILEEFVAAFYDSVKRHNPDITVSNTSVVYPYGYTLFLQNWPAWVSQGTVDFIAPQVYRYDLSAYKFELEKIITTQLPSKYDRFYPGMLIRDGNYQAPGNLAVNFILENRKYGVKGSICWFFEGMYAIGSALKHQVFQQIASPPLHPENWRPAGIIVQENSPLAQASGNWTTASGADDSSYYSFDNQIFTSAGSSGAKLTYSAEITLPGIYDVFIYQPYGTDLSNNVPVKLLFENDKQLSIDETNALTRGWIKLGTRHFSAEKHPILEIGTNGVLATKKVAADGIMLLINRALTRQFSQVRHYTPEKKFAIMKLHPNFPNPFNTSTMIAFTLPTKQNISLEIFNITGHSIWKLAQGWHDAGMYQVTFDATNLPSGIYFYRLYSKESVLTHKMMYVR